MNVNVKEIISKLSFDEKISLLTGKDLWSTVEITHADIPSIRVSDGPHGLRKEVSETNGKTSTLKSVCFPTLSAIASTWNLNIAQEIGKAIAKECGENNVDIILGPGTNIKRHPLCGRNFEYFSEDPLLAGEMAAAYITGVQSNSVGTSLKHFAANNQEYDRMQISSDIDERALREIYLKPFEIAVKKSNPWTIMCAYNRLNGIYCSENKLLLNDILRNEWKFEGIVVSDWWAVHNRALSLKASLELEMPYRDTSKEELSTAYENNLISDEEIDSAIERLLNIIFKAIESRKTRPTSFNHAEHHEIAKKAALESIILLKNEENILPISKEKFHKIAVIGALAKEPVIQGGGSANVNPTQVDSPYDKILELAGNDFIINYSGAYATHAPIVEGLNNALETAANSELVLLFAGNRNGIETECYDRTSIKLSYDMENLILKTAEHNPNTIVIVNAGSAIDMSTWINKVKAVLFMGYCGQACGSAIAEILFGHASPCGKTAETFPLKLEDTPAFDTYPGNGFSSWYSESILVGYRYYDTLDKDVLFPFGFGLSYTQFEYSDLRLSSKKINEDEKLTIKCKIKNTGNVKGKEVVQLYLHDKACKVLRPKKELKGFCKIELMPDEEKDIEFLLDREAFSYYNTSLNTWHVESGSFEILIGSSSRDIKLKDCVYINAKNDFS